MKLFERQDETSRTTRHQVHLWLPLKNQVDITKEKLHREVEHNEQTATLWHNRALRSIAR